jgi:hypothetical protein
MGAHDRRFRLPGLRLKGQLSTRLEQVERLRDQVYCRTPSRRIRSMDAAAQFVDAVGFSLLFASAQGIELPSLFEAMKGRRDAHIDDWDADADRLWVWKNDLPATRRAYYGKVLAGGKPVLVSLRMLPYLYALSAPQSVEAEYQCGGLSHYAKRVYDALRAGGPTPTLALRVAAGLDRSTSSVHYHHALDELQRALIIAPVGQTIETGAWASQIFDLVERWFPHQVERARRIDVQVARRRVVERYVRTVVAAQPSMLARVLGWPRETLTATIEASIDRGTLIRMDDWILASHR